MGQQKQTSTEEQQVMVPIHPTAITTPTGLVMVWGFEHVSAKMLGMIKIMLSHDAFETVHHGIKSIVFRTDNYPKEGGKAICATFSSDVYGIAINMDKTLERAIDRSMDHPETSLFASWWIEMMLNIGHELHHGVRWNTDREKLSANNKQVLEDEEQRAEKYAEEVIVELAQEYDIEMPSIGEESWFNSQIVELFSGKDESDEWAKSQMEMITEKVVWRCEPENSTPVVISTFKDLMCLISKGDTTSEAWNKPTIPLSQESPTLDEQLNGKKVTINAAGEQGEAVQPPTAPAPTTTATVNNDFNSEVYIDEMGEYCDEVDDVYDDHYDAQPLAPVVQPTTQPAAAKNYDSMPAAQEEPQDDMPIAVAGQIIQRVYLKMFDFIFKNCMPLKKADGSIVSPGDTINPAEGIWYSNPEAVLKTPLPLTAEEATIFVSMDHNDINGRWCPNASTNKGLLGKVMKNAGIPAYQVTLRVNGIIYKRLFIPQNPNKRNNTSGVLSGRATELRAGDTIAYIKDSDTDAWVARIENGAYVPQLP